MPLNIELSDNDNEPCIIVVPGVGNIEIRKYSKPGEKRSRKCRLSFLGPREIKILTPSWVKKEGVPYTERRES